MGLRRGLYLPARSLLLERLRCRSLLRLLFLSRLRLLFLPFFLSLLLLLLFFFLEPGLRLLLLLFLFLKFVTTRIQTKPVYRWGDQSENVLLVLVIVSICMRGLYLILSKVDTRTSWGRRWNISSRQRVGGGGRQDKRKYRIYSINNDTSNFLSLLVNILPPPPIPL